MKTATLYIWFMLLLILQLSGICHAAQTDVDTIRRKLAKENHDANTIKKLLKKARDQSMTDFEQSTYFREAFALSREMSLPYRMTYNEAVDNPDKVIEKFNSCIDSLDALGIIQSLDYPLGLIRLFYNAAGKQAEKFRYYSKKLDYYKRYGPIENTADCYHGFAGYYFFLGDYDKAIEYYMRARDVFKSFDPFGYATEGAVIGNSYLLWGNPEKAKPYLESSLKNFLMLNESSTIAYIYNNLGDLCVKRHEYSRALQYYYTEKSYWPSIDTQYIANNQVSIAAVYLQMNAIDSAKTYLRMAQEMRQKDKLRVVSNHGPLEIDYYRYRFFQATGDHVLALQSLEKALYEARFSRYFPLVLKYTYELHSYLLNRGDSIQALRYLIQYHSIQDSLNDMNTEARIASFEIEQLQQQKEIEIEQLQAQKTTQRNYYLVTGALLLLIVLAVLSRLRYKRKRDKEQLTSDFKKQLAQAETKALRAQMNPHFIFNSLNSINSFVMDQKHEIASEYLIKFSKLIRLILDNSLSETISIEKELETLKLYVLLEAARFDNRFKCVYHITGDVDTSSIMIPPMLLQPFVENAIWHGLMQKEGEGTITIEIAVNSEQSTVNSDQFLKISITDDGIGREKAAELKSKSATHKSHGLKVTSQRIEMMNRLNSSGAQVNIVDLKDELDRALGTRVELIIPF